MESFVDHYIVLGLRSGEVALKLSEEEIRKAYKLKALDLHPDKRRDDPNAREKFQRLQTSYEILKHEKTRKLFDSLLRIHREKQVKRSSPKVVNAKRRKMMPDLERRERSSTFARDDEEERISRRLKEEVERISAEEVKKRRAKEARKIVGVVPLQRAEQTDFIIPKSNLDDQAYYDLVMQRLLKAAKNQKIIMETKPIDQE